MLRIRLAPVLLPLLVVLVPSRADACSCMAGVPICQSFWTADAVFAGKVLEIVPIPNALGDDAWSRKRVRFEVQQAWRGTLGETVEVTTGAGGGDCGYRFQEGAEYIVYAHGRRGVLTTGICSRTRPLAQASEDLEYLKTGLTPSDAGRIYGTVRYDGGRAGPGPPASGSTVELSDGTRRWTATANEEGEFEFRVPAGTYRLTATTPAAQRAEGPPQVTLADARACAVAHLYVRR